MNIQFAINSTLHAAACGLDMSDCCAIGIHDSEGCILAHDVLHPETLERLVSAGVRILRGHVAILSLCGVDYVTVRAEVTEL